MFVDFEQLECYCREEGICVLHKRVETKIIGGDKFEVHIKEIWAIESP